MKICFVVDGRSPHARNWIEYFGRAGEEIHIISTFPCEPVNPPEASLHIVPLDFSARARSLGGEESRTQHGNPVLARLRGGAAWKKLAALRDQLSPAAVRLQSGRVRRIIDSIQPDIVHAMRIPYEGILAAEALRGTSYPLIISSWGNDFTLHAAGSPTVAALTERAMRRADAIHPDCEKDLHIAWERGFDRSKPSLVAPANGGVRTDIFHPGPPDAKLAAQFQLPLDAPVVINPRGVKPYVRTETFFQAIPLVLQKHPDAVFLGAMMQDVALAEQWVSRLGLQKSVRLLPFVPHAQMADFFRLASIAVSPSDHDGTPNTLLEAMATGTFPVAGSIPSVREWVEDGVNGLLCDQSSPQSLASAILRALDDDALRQRAAAHNAEMIARTVDYRSVTARAQEFYRTVTSQAAAEAAPAVR